MARILIGWEFGGGRGHAVAIAPVGRELRARGHEVVHALQRIDALAALDPEATALWPVPITPRLLVNVSRRHRLPPATLGDILARLGFDDPAIVESVLRAWDQLIAAIAPDVIIADYAPFLTLAARGCLPTLAIGSPFYTPPKLDVFPPLAGGKAALDERETLAATNAALLRLGRPPLDALAHAVRSDAALATSFAEFDPFAEFREPEGLVAPVPPLPPGELAAEEGREVFVYAPETLAPDAPLWQGLAASGLPVRAHIAHIGADYRARLAELGIVHEPRPVPFAAIAARSRILVHYGGHGTACHAALAGLPQVVCHYDLEKAYNAETVTRLGVGGQVPLHAIVPGPFAASLKAVYEDEGLRARARAKGRELAGRITIDPAVAAADRVEALLRA